MNEEKNNKQDEYEDDVTEEAIEKIRQKVLEKDPDFYKNKDKWILIDGPAW